MNVLAGSVQARRNFMDFVWLGIGAIVIGATLLMLLTVLGPLGTFGKSAERIGPGATLVGGPPEQILIDGEICHQCRPGG
jgi:hypothetical protein